MTIDLVTCADHDECSGSNDCEHFCHNTPGSYRCSCNKGYRLNGLTSCIGQLKITASDSN